MKRIRTREEADRKRKLWTWALVAFMLLLLVGGTASFIFGMVGFANTDQTGVNVGANTGRVQNVGSQWMMDFNGQPIYFSYSDQNVKDISVESYFTLQDYYNRPVYVDSNNEGVYYEIANSLGRIALRIQEACYGECDKDLPVKGCDENLIVFTESAANRVYQNSGCVFIEGDLRTVDAFLYNLFLE